MTAEIVSVKAIAQVIYLVRGQRVLLDRDLAALYGVETRVLNQAVKRNANRFPEDFMSRLFAAGDREDITICDILIGSEILETGPRIY
jgi:ORF6N domain